MQKYSEYKPTAFDTKGLACEDRQDWFVLPVSRNRDSGILDESNFSCVIKSLGGESDTLEIHRFGHWGPGWFEIALIHPSRESEGEEIECALAHYPIFDDSDFSEREHESVLPAWQAYGHAEWLGGIQKVCEFRSTSLLFDFLYKLDPQVTLEYHEQRGEKSGLEFGDDGPNFNFRYLDPRYSHFPDYYTRDELAAFIRAQRREMRKNKVDGTANADHGSFCGIPLYEFGSEKKPDEK